MVKVEVFKNDYGDFINLEEFSWDFKDYKERNMRIQLNFDNPLSISKSGPDQVIVTLLNTTMMYDSFGQELEVGT